MKPFSLSRFRALGLLLSFLAAFQPALAAVWDDECSRDFAQLMKDRGVGGKWLSESHLHDFRNEKGIKVLRVYNVYECPHCENVFPAKQENGTKITQCAGCGKKFDTDIEVHDVEYNGERVIHAAGLVTDLSGRPIQITDVVKLPMKCGHCKEIVPEKDHNCPSCGASRATATPKAVKFGDTYVLKLDDAERQGFKIEEPRPAKREAADDFDGPLAPPAGSRWAGPYVTRPEYDAPAGRRSWVPQTRRDWATTGGSAALATMIAGYFYANSGPVLEEPDELDGEIVDMAWFEDIKIQKRVGKGWEPRGKLYRAHGTADMNPDPKDPEGIPEEQLTDSSKYRVEREGYYVLHIKRGGRVIPQSVGREEYLQWRKHDTVRLRVKENGALQGIDRTGRSK